MASIREVRLHGSSAGHNVAIHIAYDVHFDAFDLASNQLYQQSWALSDESIGRCIQVEQGALDIVRFAADGNSWTTREIDLLIPPAQLAHEPGDAEIRAVVTLTPVGPFGDSAQSNRMRTTVR
jgi:hypothetical protein